MNTDELSLKLGTAIAEAVAVSALNLSIDIGIMALCAASSTNYKNDNITGSKQVLPKMRLRHKKVL